MPRDRNNFKAGLFVIVGVVLLCAVIIQLVNIESWFTSMQTIETRFLLDDGLKGLKVGATVTIGGTPKGAVTEVIEETSDQGVVIASIVRFEIPADYKVYENAVFELQVPTIGTNTTLNIRDFGGEGALDKPHGTGWLYEPGVDPPIAGGLGTSEAIDAAVRQLGIGAQQRREIQGTIRDVRLLVGALAGTIQEQELTEQAKQLRDSVADLRETLASARRLAAVLEKDLPPITSNVGKTAVDLKAIVDDVIERYTTWLDGVDAFVVTANDAVKKADLLMADSRGAVGTVQGMLDENRPTIRSTLTAANDVATAFRDETLQQINARLETAGQVVDDVKGFALR